ncbi:MAG: hypothetical protein ACUVV5_00345 [Candidatus Aminicenantales bacterium]
MDRPFLALGNFWILLIFILMVRSAIVKPFVISEKCSKELLVNPKGLAFRATNLKPFHPTGGAVRGPAGLP